MSQWQGHDDKDKYYILVDSKPDETVDNTKPDTIFCTAFVNTASCINGVRNPDLPWLKQYKECKSLEESKSVLQKLIGEIMNGNFQDLYIWILSSHFSTIDRNGMTFLKGIEREIDDLIISDNYIMYKRDRFKLDKAKMLIWYNFCLCNMATFLVDQTLKWKKSKGVFLIDRLGDSDKRIQIFMRMLMQDSSLRQLWNRCAEDHSKKPDYIGYEFASHLDNNGKIIPATNSMQASLVDWIVLAAYAERNGTQNRDPAFQSNLVNLIHILNRFKLINGIHFDGDVTWQ
ncbi:MAG: hypothetical protein AAF434_10390 [Pseudomonadota bacterium]